MVSYSSEIYKHVLSDNNHQEISEIKRQIKLLNLAGLGAIISLTVAGAMLIYELTAADEVINRQSAQIVQAEITPVAFDAANEQDAGNQTSEIRSESPISKADEPGKTDSKKKKPVQEDTSRSLLKIDSELQSFEASCNQGALLFSWVTDGSRQYMYEIEKSTDQEHYEVFSRAPAPQKVDGKYIYTIEETASTTDQAWYRLRKVAGKGKFEFSSEVLVNCAAGTAAQTAVDVFPNGYGSFRIVINAPAASTFRVTLTDVNDRELASRDFDAKPGSNEFTLISDSITRGNYVLRLSNDYMVKEKRVVLK